MFWPLPWEGMGLWGLVLPEVAPYQPSPGQGGAGVSWGRERREELWMGDTHPPQGDKGYKYPRAGGGAVVRAGGLGAWEEVAEGLGGNPAIWAASPRASCCLCSPWPWCPPEPAASSPCPVPTSRARCSLFCLGLLLPRAGRRLCPPQS